MRFIFTRIDETIFQTVEADDIELAIQKLQDAGEISAVRNLRTRTKLEYVCDVVGFGWTRMMYVKKVV